MAFLQSLVVWYEHTSLYNGFMVYMPPPFNDLYFGTAILAIVMLMLVFYIVEKVRTIMTRQKVRRKQEEVRNRRIEEAEEEERRRNAEFEKQSALITGVTAALSGAGANNNVASTNPGNSFEYEAHHDVTTGLWNKLGFQKHFEKLTQTGLGIVYVDVNNLKKTNDTLGHEYGDRLLFAVASELKEQFGDKCYRTGGDEFIVLLEGVGERIISRKIDNIRTALQARTESDPDGVIYAAAFGVAIGDGSLTKKELLKLAENRMNEDKAAYKRAYRQAHGDDGYVDNRVYDTPISSSNISPKSNDDETTVADEYVNLRDHDALTKVWNRESYEEELKSINETNLTLIYADLDGLKYINEKIGHEAGNKLISSFAKVLNRHFPNEVYRLADDDFAILTYNKTEAEVERKIDLVKADLIRLTQNDEEGIFYSASFGVSVNNGELIYYELVNECETALAKDKTTFRTGRRTGVVLTDMSLMPSSETKKETTSVYNKEEILRSRRAKYSDEAPAPEFGSDNALSSILSSIKSQEEAKEQEALEQEERNRQREENLSSIESSVKSKYEHDDSLNIEAMRNRQRKQEEKARQQELQRLQREQQKKSGLFGYKKNKKNEDSSNSGSSSMVDNTVTDIDLLT